MKISFEQEDINQIVLAVVDRLKPLLKKSGRIESEDNIFDVKGLAQYLKLDESWIYKQVSLKAIPFFKCGKYTRFKKSAIDRWVESEAVKPIPPLKMVNKSR